MELLNVLGLTVQFPRLAFRAVEEVSLTVAEGETLALVGESGCGKTMTARALLRLPPPGAHVEAEAIRLRGRDLARLKEREMRHVRGKEIGMVFQEPLAALNPLYTIGEQVAEGLRYHEGLRRCAAHRRAVELLEEVGIPDPAQQAGEYPHRLSGGMRQRAMVAIAIACRPALLIADEPTTALDVSVQAQILEMLRRLQAQRGMSILLITHDLGVVAEMAHRVAVMHAARIVEDADVRALFARPGHPYTRLLLTSALNVSDASDSRVRASGPEPGALESGLPVTCDPYPLTQSSQLSPGCHYAPRCPHAGDLCRGRQAMVEMEPGHGVRCSRPEGCNP